MAEGELVRVEIEKVSKLLKNILGLLVLWRRKTGRELFSLTRKLLLELVQRAATREYLTDRGAWLSKDWDVFEGIYHLLNLCLCRLVLSYSRYCSLSHTAVFPEKAGFQQYAH